MSDVSDEEDAYACQLGAQECDRLCNEFADITRTDTVVAMMFLQRNMWDLRGAIETYYNQFIKGDDRPLAARLKAASASGSKEKLSKEKKLEHEAATSTEPNSRRPPSSLLETKRIKVLSWNTDGIDESEPKARARCVSNVILKEDPDIVLLQEIISDTAEIYEEKLIEKYDLKFADFGSNLGYFTAVAVKRETGEVELNKFGPFDTSIMGRGLQALEANMHGVPVTVMTSHLESMKDYTKQRVGQLTKVFGEARDVDIARVVLVGGDFNLREHEIISVGGPPRGFHDAWEATGRREIARWTWDMSRNDNHGQFPGSAKNAKARFDRLYFRSADDVILKPVYFELVGLEKISPLRRFPSDHWGILFHADLSPSSTHVA